jgi:hypothetical protein
MWTLLFLFGWCILKPTITFNDNIRPVFMLQQALNLDSQISLVRGVTPNQIREIDGFLERGPEFKENFERATRKFVLQSLQQRMTSICRSITVSIRKKDFGTGWRYWRNFMIKPWEFVSYIFHIRIKKLSGGLYGCFMFSGIGTI